MSYQTQETQQIPQQRSRTGLWVLLLALFIGGNAIAAMAYFASKRSDDTALAKQESLVKKVGVVTKPDGLTIVDFESGSSLGTTPALVEVKETRLVYFQRGKEKSSAHTLSTDSTELRLDLSEMFSDEALKKASDEEKKRLKAERAKRELAYQKEKKRERAEQERLEREREEAAKKLSESERRRRAAADKKRKRERSARIARERKERERAANERLAQERLAEERAEEARLAKIEEEKLARAEEVRLAALAKQDAAEEDVPASNDEDEEGAEADSPPVESKPAPPKTSAKAPNLQQRVRVFGAAELVRQFRGVESQLVSRGGLSSASGVTAGLASSLVPSLTSGDAIEIYPRGAYWFVIERKGAGASLSQITKELVAAHKSGRLKTFGAR